jgi:hypothetical protein
VLLFTFIFWVPYVIWNCVDFLRPALYTKEVKKIENLVFEKIRNLNDGELPSWVKVLQDTR